MILKFLMQPYQIEVNGFGWKSTFVIRGFDDYALMLAFLQEETIKKKYKSIVTENNSSCCIFSKL